MLQVGPVTERTKVMPDVADSHAAADDDDGGGGVNDDNVGVSG